MVLFELVTACIADCGLCHLLQQLTKGQHRIFWTLAQNLGSRLFQRFPPPVVVQILGHWIGESEVGGWAARV